MLCNQFKAENTRKPKKQKGNACPSLKINSKNSKFPQINNKYPQNHTVYRTNIECNQSDYAFRSQNQAQ